MIQFPLFIGEGKLLADTQLPGAQLLFIKAGVYVYISGFVGIVLKGMRFETVQTGSKCPTLPFPVDKSFKFGKDCEKLPNEIRNKTIYKK